MNALTESYSIVLAWQKELSGFSASMRDYLSFILRNPSNGEIVIKNVNQENEVEINAIIKDVEVDILITSYPALILNFNQYNENIYDAINTVASIIFKKLEKIVDTIEVSYVGIYDINEDIFKIIKDNIGSIKLFPDMSPFSIRLYNANSHVIELLTIEPYANLRKAVYTNYTARCKTLDICINVSKKRIEEMVKYFEKM
ncbi:hypothetical protein [Sulfurisphaera ohwakuensis]|uniref:hypothetical protein n=1 Tax=Sulfurisphaera ohwakuensis TaxID=69656 RepID=UPI0036F27869